LSPASWPRSTDDQPASHLYQAPPAAAWPDRERLAQASSSKLALVQPRDGAPDLVFVHPAHFLADANIAQQRDSQLAAEMRAVLLIDPGPRQACAFTSI
jgi:hypothetical protein